jgi:hypothetical protein
MAVMEPASTWKPGGSRSEDARGFPRWADRADEGRLGRFFQRVEQLLLEHLPGSAPKEAWPRTGGKDQAEVRAAGVLRLEELEQRYGAWVREEYHRPAQKGQGKGPRGAEGAKGAMRPRMPESTCASGSVGGARGQETGSASRVGVRLKVQRPVIQRPRQREGRRDRSGMIHSTVPNGGCILKIASSVERCGQQVSGQRVSRKERSAARRARRTQAAEENGKAENCWESSR